VNASGAVIVAWAGSGGTIVTDSGTVLGGFAAPVTIAPAAYRQGSPAVALNDAGQASLVWRGRTTVLAAMRSAGGTWSTTSQLIANASGSVDTAIDSSGNAVAAFVQYNAAAGTFPVYVSQHPAGGRGERRLCCLPRTTTRRPPRPPLILPGQSWWPGRTTTA
jgi:hypothetical protein